MTFAELMENKEYKIAMTSTALTGVISLGANMAGWYMPRKLSTKQNIMYMTLYSSVAIMASYMIWMEDVHKEGHESGTFQSSIINGFDRFGMKTQNLLDDVFHFNIKDLGNDILDFIPN